MVLKRSGKSVSLHFNPSRPVVCTYATMTTVVEVLFYTLYYVIEA